MQYKIPVQIENEDPIVLGLSIRQLAICITFFMIAYSLFTSLEQTVGTEIALIPSLFIGILGFVIAIFKQSEMTFIPFVLAMLRNAINPKERMWQWKVDSFQPIDIGYLTKAEDTKQENVDFTSKMDKIQELDEQLKNI